MKNRFFFICVFTLITSLLSAQKVNFDEIKEQCTGLKQNQKVRLSVSNFDVSTMSNPGQFGGELAQMLTDALQNLNCFNVLLSIKDSKALTDEIAFGQSGNTAEGSSPTKGKMKGAQVVVMGKVTSYSSGEKKGGALGVNVTGGNKAKVGFIIQLINAETRELIASQSIDVEGKTGGLSGVKVLGVSVAGGMENKAVQEVCQKGIVKAVEFIASKKSELPLPEQTSDVASTEAANKPTTEITLLNADYTKLKALADLLTSKAKVLSKTIEEGKGLIKLEFAGSSDAIADFIDSKAASKFSIKNLDAGKITVVAKD